MSVLGTIKSIFAHKSSYIACIGAMKKRLLKLQDNDKKAKKLKTEILLKG